MKQILSIIILALIVSSCATQKRCARKFPPQIITEKEVITEIVYRDTTIFVYIPADTVYAEKVIFKTPDGYQTDLSVLHLQYSKSTARVLKGVLLHELFQKDTAIEQVIKNAVKEQSTHTTDTVTKIHEVPYTTAWHHFTTRFFWVAIAFGLVYMLFRFLRR